MADSDEVLQSGANFQIGDGNEATVESGLGIPKDLGLDIDRDGQSSNKEGEAVTAQTLTIPDVPETYKMPKAENSEISTDYGSTNNDSLLGMSSKKNSKAEESSPKKDSKKIDKEDEDYLRRRSGHKDLEKGNVNEDDENDDSTGVELRIFGRLMSQMKISLLHTILVVYAIFIPFRLLLCSCFGMMLSDAGSDKDSDDKNDRTKWTVLGVSLDNFFSCMAMMVILFHLTKYKFTSRSLGVTSFGMLWTCLFFMFWVSVAQIFSGPNSQNSFIKLFNGINIFFILATGGATAYGFYQWRDANQPAQTEAEKKALLKEKRREEKRRQKEKKTKEEKKEKKEDKDDSSAAS